MDTMSGYKGTLIWLDLLTGTITEVSTAEYSHNFIGGIGIASKIYWENVPPHIGAFDSENHLIFITGPCTCLEGLAGSRCIACGKSPASTPNYFSHSNFGGNWGAFLKLAGFDGLIVHGKADKPCYIVIDDHRIEIRDARNLWGRGAVEVREVLKNELGNSFSVLTTGPAGDNMAVQATILADNDASGSGGLGAVMGSKNLKAIAVRGSGTTVEVAEPERLKDLLQYVAELREGMPRIGEVERKEYPTQKYHCFGCTDICPRGNYEAKDGSLGKFMCQSSVMYIQWAEQYYGQPTDVPFYANHFCDDYGLNTKAIAIMISWLNRCYKEGVLSEKNTGLPLSKIGSLEFIQALTTSIAHRQGFGDVLAQGLQPAVSTLGSDGVTLLTEEITKIGDSLGYGPRGFITTGLLHAVEVREPIQQLHEVSRLCMEWVRWANGLPGAELSSDVFRSIAKRFWGSEIAADFSTYEGKALAAKMIQDRELAKESLILCDFAWPIQYVLNSPDHVGDPSLESQIYSAITGREMTEDELYRVGERILNLQRSILLREGRLGRQDDTIPETCYTIPLSNLRLNDNCLFPGKDGAIISRKGSPVDREKFQKILTEYYRLRGWDPETGLQRKSTLGNLELEYVAQDLQERGLLT